MSSIRHIPKYNILQNTWKVDRIETTFCLPKYHLVGVSALREHLTTRFLHPFCIFGIFEPAGSFLNIKGDIMTRRAVIYIRTSSETQGEKSSPAEQEADCRRLAHEKGLQVVCVYRDVEKY
jgi:hypothetical protein